MLLNLRYQNSDGITDDRLEIGDRLLRKDMGKHLSLRLMLRLNTGVGHMSEFSCTSVIPSIFEEVCSMAVDVVHSSRIGYGDVLRCDANMGTELLVRLIDGKIMLIFQILEDP